MMDKKRVSVYLDENDYNRLKKISRENFCSMSHCMVSFFEFWSRHDQFPDMEMDLKWRYWYH